MRKPHKKPTAEQKKTWDAKYYQKNKEVVQARHKKYRDSHIEQTRKQNRESYYRNHERSLELKRLRNNKRIYKENYEILSALFDGENMPMDANIKAKFLSMIRAEVFLSNIKAKQENDIPEIGLMKLHDDAFDKTWEIIAMDDELMGKIKLYILQADPNAYNDLTI